MELTRSAPAMVAAAAAWARAATSPSGWTPGVQVWARRGSSQVDLALGTSPFIGTMRRTVLHDVGPMVDAVVALGVLAAAEQAGVPLDAPVPPWVDPASRTIGDVLCGRPGSGSGSGSGSGGRAADGAAPVGVLEWLAGADAAGALSALVTEPLGIDDEMRFSVDAGEVPPMQARCGAMVRRTPRGDVALAAPLRARELGATHAGRGGWVSARAVGQVFGAWNRLSARRPEPRLALPTPGYVRDAWTNASHLVARPADAGGPTWRGPGLVRNIGGCLSLALSPLAFGRVGAAGAAIAACDPDIDLTVVIVTNAVCEAWAVRRARFDGLLAEILAVSSSAGTRRNDRAVGSGRA